MNNKKLNHHIFFILAIFLTFIYLGWMLIYWPGTLSEDSLAILLEVESNGNFSSGKPTAWFYFVKLFYGFTGYVEVPIFIQFIIAIILFTRLLGWQWLMGYKKIFFFCLIFICCTPHMILFIGSLNPDGIHSVATVSLMFEVWLITKRKKLERKSFFILCLTAPISLFFRPNGIIFLLAFFIAIYFVSKIEKIKIVALIVVLLSLNYYGDKIHQTTKLNPFFALAAFESVNFLQPHPMNVWRAKPRVSEKTIALLTKNVSLPVVLKYYDKDYWDTLVFLVDGPHLFSLTPEEKNQLINEFWKENIWQNIPAFISSRVNILLVSALAEGGLSSPYYNEIVLSKVHAKTKVRPFELTTMEKIGNLLYRKSEYYRWILWTPFLGFGLIIWITIKSIFLRRKLNLIIISPFILQFFAIFFFSAAGEYRYLLIFFTAPVFLLLMMQENTDLNY